MAEAARWQRQTGKPARAFTEFPCKTTTGSRSRARRVVAKAEQLESKENPRIVVTNLDAQGWPTQPLYEQLYCERGEMANRIKEQLSLFEGRVSAETMPANQLHWYVAAGPTCGCTGCADWGGKGRNWCGRRPPPSGCGR